MSAHLVIEAVIDEFSVNDFTEKQQIGSGGEGEVFRGCNVRLGNVAVKKLYRQINKTEMNEVILLAKHSNHPNIIRLFGLLTLEEDYLPNSSTFCRGYIMEYMENGSLYNMIHNTSVEYDMKQAYSWIEKASSGLQYLHEKGIMHRDINPQNILLGKSLDDLRISDFGRAKAVETMASHTGGIGTIDYMAPELHNTTKYDKSADIYSLTITFWEIIHREKPYGYMGVITNHNKTNRILNGERPNIQKELEISALLVSGWDSNPKSRPKISEFIECYQKKRPAQENLRKVVSQQNLPIQNEEEFNSPVRKRMKFLAQNVDKNENKVEKQSGGQQNTSVLILGGDGPLNTIYLLDSKAQSWKKLSITLPVGLSAFGAVVLNKEIYIFGGYYDEYYQQGCYKLKNDGNWMRLASMNKKRAYISSSSLVYKGNIWAIGGCSEDSGDFGENLKSVEKYDILKNKWTYMPKMNYARGHAAAAVFKDRIFVTGGNDDEENLKSVEVFDPKLQKWIFFCDLPFVLSCHTMLINNTTLSIFGGESWPDILNSVWEMDIEDPKKEWTEKQSFKHSRYDFGIGNLSNGIIVFGDLENNGGTSEIFDENKWIGGPKLPQKLSEFAYTSIPRSLEESFLKKFEDQNTSVLIMGGLSDAFEDLNTIYLLDSKAQSWKKLSITLPVGLHSFGAVVLNQEIYIFGGVADWNPQQDCYKLKADGSWMKLASLNQERSDISSSSLVYKGDIWAIGGCFDAELKSAEKYDIFKNKWTYMPRMNYARREAAAAVFKDRIFVTGGWNYETFLKSVEMFDPKLQKWTFFCDLPITVSYHTMLINNTTLSIFGGGSSPEILNSVWEMDIEDPEKKWTVKECFKQLRDCFGIGNLSNGIIVFGDSGNNGGTSEIFVENEWIDGPRLPQKLSHFAYTSIPRSLEENFLKKFEDQNTSVLILGGWSSPNAIYLLDSKAQSWKKLRITLPVRLHSFGAVVFNQEIYIFGGISADGYQQDCYKLKNDESWMKLASLNQKRAYISSSSLVYKGDIWAIGGYSGDSGEYLKSVEKYYISQNKWTFMPEMNYARHGAAAAVFKDRIFVTGGWNGEHLKSVEIFDPKLKKWILFCDLPIEVGGHTMLISNSILSIFGGSSESDLLNKVWEMDIEDPEKKWTEKQNFKHPRANFGIGNLSNGIIVFGGWRGYVTPDDSNLNVETETFDENKWIDGPKLPQKLGEFAYISIPRFLEEIFLKKCS